MKMIRIPTEKKEQEKLELDIVKPNNRFFVY